MKGKKNVRDHRVNDNTNDKEAEGSNKRKAKVESRTPIK
jgi:hypothetical protein